MRDDPAVVELVLRARNGDKAAWDSIVERYAPLVWSVCRRHGLYGVDAEDAGAGVWLRLVENLSRLREPAALPGWLATTARRECLQVLNSRNRVVPVEAVDAPSDPGPSTEEWVLTQELHAALRQAFAGLPENCRRLLELLFRDPPAPYGEVSATLGMALGAIGPSRKRCLERLRSSKALHHLDDFSPAMPGQGAVT